MTLTPAYGRDYKSVKAVKEDFDAGKDFMINDVSSKDDGRYANKEDLIQAGVKAVKIRYARLTKVTILKL
jgi:hypothetical protein